MSDSSLKLALPSMEDLLKKGVHFGHKDSKWHPNMAPYLYGSRNSIHIIDLAQTLDMLRSTLLFLKKAAQEGKTILLVGTKKSVKELVKKHAQEAHVPYVNERWLGGTITNFGSIYGLVKNLKSIEEKEQAPDYTEKYNKKERLDFSEEKARLEKMIGGIKHLAKLPDIIFVADVRQDVTAVKEASRKGIPIVGIVDSNVDPHLITHPIPANDDSVKSVDLMLQLVSAAIQEGHAEAPTSEAPSSPAAEAAKAQAASAKQEEQKDDQKED